MTETATVAGQGIEAEIRDLLVFLCECPLAVCPCLPCSVPWKAPCYGLCHPFPLVLRPLLVVLPWETPADTEGQGSEPQIVTILVPFLSATVQAGLCLWGHSFRAH